MAKAPDLPSEQRVKDCSRLVSLDFLKMKNATRLSSIGAENALRF